MNRFCGVTLWEVGVCLFCIIGLVALHFILRRVRLLFLLLGIALLILGELTYCHIGGIEKSLCADMGSPAAQNVTDTSVVGGTCVIKALCGERVLLHVKAICRSLSSFFPSRGDYEAPCGVKAAESHADCDWNYCYWIFHVGVLFYVLTLLIAIFGIEVVNALRIVLRYPFLSLNVFWDSSDAAQLLADGISREKCFMFGRWSVVFALSEEKKTWLHINDGDSPVHVFAKKGWKWLFCSPAAPGWILTRACRHYFLSENGQENVAKAENLVRRLKRRWFPLRKVYVYVRINVAADDDVLYRWADKLNADGGRIEIVVIREDALVSRQFLLDHPMLDCPGIKISGAPDGTIEGEFRILMLGFGIQGKRIMNDMICDAQYLGKSGRRVPLCVDVLDKDAASYGWYKANCTTAISRYSIGFSSNVDFEKAEFWVWLKNRKPYSRIIVCTHDDRANISLASEIARFYMIHYAEYWNAYKKPGQAIVYARVRDTDVNRYVTWTFENDETPPFLPFGGMATTYSPKSVIIDRWDKGAIWMNGVYCIGRNELPCWKKAERSWRLTSVFDRESTRSAIVFQRNMIRLMHYDVVLDDKKPRDAVEPELIKREACKMIRVFSQIEHLRWMAFHFVRGIECWHPDEVELRKLAAADAKTDKYKDMSDADKANVQIVKPNMLLKGRKKHLHAALVEFNDLSVVDCLFNKVNRCFNFKHDMVLENKDFELTLGLDSLIKTGFSFVERRY